MVCEEVKGHTGSDYLESPATAVAVPSSKALTPLATPPPATYCRSAFISYCTTLVTHSDRETRLLWGLLPWLNKALAPISRAGLLMH